MDRRRLRMYLHGRGRGGVLALDGRTWRRGTYRSRTCTPRRCLTSPCAAPPLPEMRKAGPCLCARRVAGDVLATARINATWTSYAKFQELSGATTVGGLPSSRRVNDRLTLPALPPSPAPPTAHHGTPAKPRALSTSRARGLVSSAEEGECGHPHSARGSTDLACAVPPARARRRRASESASLRERTRRGGLSGMAEGGDGIRIAYVCTYSRARGRAVWRSSR